MLKTFKNLLLQNQKSYDLETWHVALRTQALQSLKGKTIDFSETIVVYDLKLATDDRSDKKFQNFVPWGLYAPALGLYTCIKSWQKMYKIRLQRDFFETCNKWVKW